MLINRLNKNYNNVAVSVSDGGGYSNISTTICDTEELKLFAEGLKTRASTLEDNITTIYEIIDNMPQDEAWDGQIYAQFKNKVHSFENPMKAYVALVNEYATIIDKIREYGENTLEPKIKKYSEGTGK